MVLFFTFLAGLGVRVRGRSLNWSPSRELDVVAEGEIVASLPKGGLGQT